ncbi:MAG: Bifunctional polymyxin resistance protein ArnA [Elusimicrobia bacterium]|nr:Bifunctional polymyxin resistance protein ArnA [Elusimicrobiota bacterium]
MKSSRIVVFAYSDLGHACLKFLLEQGENVVGVYTHADNPQETLWFPSVQKLAEEYSVPVRLSDNLKSENEEMFVRALKPDLLFSFYYRRIIPLSLLKIPSLGAFNMHGSLLPQYRGRAPINWAILKGEKKTGATLHVMTERPDAGEWVDQEEVSIEIDDTAQVVQKKVTKAALMILARQLDALKNGRAPRHPQNEAQSSYFGRRGPQDGEINWNWPAEHIHNLVRAVTHPFPGAFGSIQGEKTLIWKTHLTPINFPERQPGEIVLDQNRFFVVCGDKRALEIISIQKEGQREMSGKEFEHMVAPAQGEERK